MRRPRHPAQTMCGLVLVLGIQLQEKPRPSTTPRWQQWHVRKATLGSLETGQKSSARAPVGSDEGPLNELGALELEAAETRMAAGGGGGGGATGADELA